MTTVNLSTLRRWSSGLQGPDAGKPLALGSGGQFELLEPRSPPGFWTRFKAALVNLPLIGRLGAIQAADREVRTARQTYGEIRDRAVRFGDDFHRDLSALVRRGDRRQRHRRGERPARQHGGPWT